MRKREKLGYFTTGVIVTLILCMSVVPAFASGTVSISPDVATAYLAELEAHKDNIRFPNTDGRNRANEVVSIADVCGDATPELLYLMMTPGGEYGADLHIVSFMDGKAREVLLYEGAVWDMGEGVEIVAFLNETGDFYIWHGMGITSLIKYELNGNSLAGETIISIRGSGSDGSDWNYYAGESEISESEFLAKESELLSSAAHVCLSSCSPAEIAESPIAKNPPPSAMTYAEAEAYLNGYVTSSSPTQASVTAASTDAIPGEAKPAWAEAFTGVLEQNKNRIGEFSQNDLGGNVVAIGDVHGNETPELIYKTYGVPGPVEFHLWNYENGSANEIAVLNGGHPGRGTCALFTSADGDLYLHIWTMHMGYVREEFRSLQSVLTENENPYLSASGANSELTEYKHNGVGVSASEYEDIATELLGNAVRIWFDGGSLFEAEPVAMTYDDAIESLAEAASGDYAAASVIEAARTSAITLIDDKNTEFDAYEIAGNNYFKLRDIAFTLSGTEKQFDVEWNEDENAISLTSGRPYTAVGGEMSGGSGGTKTPIPNDSKILLNGVEVQMTAYNIDGNNYFKLRDIGRAIDFDVDWDAAANSIVIKTDANYTE